VPASLNMTANDDHLYMYMYMYIGLVTSIYATGVVNVE